MRFTTFDDEEVIHDEDKRPTVCTLADATSVASGNKSDPFYFCRDDDVRNLWKTQVLLLSDIFFWPL